MIQDTAWSPRFVPSTTATAATSGEAIAGTDTTKFITPSLLPAATSYHAGPVVNGRAPRQGLVFDGTAGATVANVPALGTTYTIAAWVNPANVSGVKVVVGTATQNPLNISDADVYSAGGAAGLTVSSGKNQLIVLSVSSGTVTPYLNTIAGSSYSDSTNVTAPISIGSNNTGTGYPWNGTISVLIYNRALSASEVVALYEAGAPSGADYARGINDSGQTVVAGQPQLNAANSTLTSNTGFWNVVGSVTFGAGGATFGASSYIYKSGLLIAKMKYRVEVTISAIGGDAYFGDSSIAGGYLTVNTPGIKTFEFTANSSVDSFSFYSYTSATITNFTLTPIGLLLAPDAAQAGGGYVWNDQSGNLAQIVLPSSGVQWALPSVAGQRIRGTTSTNGNQQLLGASVLLPAECQITHVRARARSGTPTITIGTASGGAQIVASVALSTTWLNCTIALTGGIVSSADDIWIGSNSTDVVETDIAFQPLDF